MGMTRFHFLKEFIFVIITLARIMVSVSEEQFMEIFSRKDARFYKICAYASLGDCLMPEDSSYLNPVKKIHPHSGISYLFPRFSFFYDLPYLLFGKISQATGNLSKT